MKKRKNAHSPNKEGAAGTF